MPHRSEIRPVWRFNGVTTVSLRFLVATAVVLTALTAFSADTKLDLGSADRDTEYVTSVDHTSLANGNTKVLANQDGTVSIISGAGGSTTNAVVTTATDKKTWYSECNTSGSPRVVTTTTGDFQLVDGAMITIYFKQTMSYQTTLDIDNTGAKSIVGSKSGWNSAFWWKTGGQTATFVYSASRNKYIYMEDEIDATTSRSGVVTLNSLTNSTLESYAATPKAVKMVADAVGEERAARLSAGYVTKSVTNGLAARTWVDSHQWDWVTQVTNKPGYVLKSGDTMTGNLTLDNEDPFVKVFKTGGKYDYYTTVKAGQLINSDSEHYTATLTLPIVSGTFALLSDIPSVSGLASVSWVDSHQWDWTTQVTNKPNIPAAANNGTLTIQQNGKQLGTFGANQSSNTTVNVKGVYYATCNTAQNTASKVATLKNANETFVLEEGVIVYVNFSYPPAPNTANTLNVAGSGAKSIKLYTLNANLNNGYSFAWGYNSIVGFAYTGSFWSMLRPVVADQANEGTVRFSNNAMQNSELAAVRADSLYKVGTSIAPLWVKTTSKSYSAGDYVMYTDGKLYKAKVDIAANTSWNASNWQAVTVKDVLSTKADTTWVNAHQWDWGTQITNAPAFVTKSVTNGLASVAYVDSHKWDWATQVTNKPAIPTYYDLSGTHYLTLGSSDYNMDSFASMSWVDNHDWDWSEVTNKPDLVEYTWDNGSKYIEANGYFYGSSGYKSFEDIVTYNDSTAYLGGNSYDLSSFVTYSGSSIYVNGGSYDLSGIPTWSGDTMYANGSSYYLGSLGSMVTYDSSGGIYVNGSTYYPSSFITSDGSSSISVGGSSYNLNSFITSDGTGSIYVGGSSYNLNNFITSDGTGSIYVDGNSYNLGNFVSHSGSSIYIDGISYDLAGFLSGSWSNDGVISYGGNTYNLGAIPTWSGNTMYANSTSYDLGHLDDIPSWSGSEIRHGGSSWDLSSFVTYNSSNPSSITVGALTYDLSSFPTYSSSSLSLGASTYDLSAFPTYSGNSISLGGAVSYDLSAFLTSEDDPTIALTNNTLYVHGDTINILSAFEESDPTIGLTNGTLYVHGSTVNPVVFGSSNEVDLGTRKSGSSTGSNSFSFGYQNIANSSYSQAIGVHASATNNWAYVWRGGGSLTPAVMNRAPYYGSHGDGTFNILPVGGASGFWIGETNLETFVTSKIPTDYVSASTATNIARAIISDALANVNVNIQSAEDTRVALTNLITILKSL